jgi:anthranilate synthase component 1
MEFAEFKSFGEKYNVIPLIQELLVDGETPLTLYDKLTKDQEGTFLLESAEHGGIWSRFSFIGISSFSTLFENNGKLAWQGLVPEGMESEIDFLTGLEKVSNHLKSPQLPGMPPLTGGLVGYLSYDVIRQIEKIPDTTVDDLNIPQGIFMIASDLAVFDHLRGVVIMISNAINWNGKRDGIEFAYQDAKTRLSKNIEKLNLKSDLTPIEIGEVKEVIFERGTSESEYLAGVEKIKSEIFNGEAFQVVYSQRFEMVSKASPFNIYRSLRLTNPSPYMYYLRLPGLGRNLTVVGSSPESIIKINQQEAVIHPIAGTRARNSDPAEDIRLGEELLNDPKEKAEHLMLVDLGRNDLNRVSLSGTVKVVEFMKIERYSHVMHIVSTITSKIRAGISPLAALLSVFPAGTLSGAPKVRAMEIIEENEKTKRGLYGGAVGYLDFHGNLDACIAIRTALIEDNKVIIQAGAGIVLDSDAMSENLECLNKAKAVMRAVAQAESFN